MAARFLIPMDNLYLRLTSEMAELPFPLSVVLDSHDVMKDLLKLSIGYEDRRNLEHTSLGGMLFQAGVIPFIIESFITKSLNDLELTLLKAFNLKLHYSTHTFLFLNRDTLMVNEGDPMPVRTNQYIPTAPTARDLRIWQEQQLELEKEAAYASY